MKALKKCNSGFGAKRSRLAIASLALVTSVVATSACGTDTGGVGTPPTAPTDPGKPSPAMIIAASPTEQAGLLGTPAWFQPRFQVVDASGKLLSGVTATCSVSSAAGSVHPNAVTNTLGAASCSFWVLGTVAGDDTLVVAVPGVVPVLFVAHARDASYFQIYDLQTIDGAPVPGVYFFDTIGGGQFVLSPDGTCTSSELRNGTTYSTSGTFKQSADTLVFYDVAGTSVWAIGSLAGDSLTFDSGDDFDGISVWVYVKRK